MIDPVGAMDAPRPNLITPTVRQLMSPPQPGIDQFDTVMSAARRMRASGAVSLPVSDERGLFVGMLSDRDIVERCAADGRDPRAVTVGSLLQGQQQVIDPDRAADPTVLAMIVRQPLAELPVIENGVLVGMISVADLAIPMVDIGASDNDLDGFWPTDLVVTRSDC
jgi:CBS domain-containing protein